MRANPLLKWLLIPLAAVFVIFVLRHAPDGRGNPPSEAASQLTREEMKALGIEGDTPHDTVATLVAQVKQLRGELRGALSENKEQKAENERLRAREVTIDQRISSALDGERDRLREEREQAAGERLQAETLLRDLQRRVEGMPDNKAQSDLPVGLGLEDGDGKRFAHQGATRWIEPDDVKPAKKDSPGGAAFPTSFGPAQRTLSNTGNLAGTERQGETHPLYTLRPVYTLPANATLVGSVALTALIGRVPIDGTVNDPYPFKVLIGPDNLTANGIELPDVAGAVVSGTASGDWTLSCVRGQIRSVTFVFNDGTIRTLPDAGQNRENGGGGSRSTGSGSGLGWISDPQGIPCISGERRSNAQQYLGSHALITAAGAGAASLIKSDSGSVAVVSSSNGSLGTVGISGNEAMGRILAGGVRDMADWVNKLYGQAFAAIYVPPGASVAVHLEQPLDIDYAPKGRRVNYLAGEIHAPDID